MRSCNDPRRAARPLLAIAVSLVLAFGVMSAARATGVTRYTHRKIYDALVKAAYPIHRRASPEDVVLVTIDNRTLGRMEERWPYSRVKFARVIDNLKAAGAGVIAFDFIFYGSSAPEEDAALKKAIEDAGNVVLGAAVDEDGRAHVSRVGREGAVSGVVTELQDPDGVTRKALTYLVTSGVSGRGFLSWGLCILKFARGADFANLSDEGSVIRFKSGSGEAWEIPVEPETKSFLINFRSHTSDLEMLSFYDVLNGDFDRGLVKGRIALVGTASTIFGDIHDTPLGWMPGITLNANAFLTLYHHDFLKMAPAAIGTIIAALAAVAASLAASFLSAGKAAVFICALLILFLAASLALLVLGFVWNYSAFLLVVISCPPVTKKLLDLAGNM